MHICEKVVVFGKSSLFSAALDEFQAHYHEVSRPGAKVFMDKRTHNVTLEQTALEMLRTNNHLTLVP